MGGGGCVVVGLADSLIGLATPPPLAPPLLVRYHIVFLGTGSCDV